jgi:hypothetical protein|tara:strand:- start:1333 stop:1704 length:372 start_codon:yes stop_codon:yes gene_type:complete
VDEAVSVIAVDVVVERRGDEVALATVADAVDHEEDSAVEAAVASQEVEAAVASHEVVVEVADADEEATRGMREPPKLFVMYPLERLDAEEYSLLRCTSELYDDDQPIPRSSCNGVWGLQWGLM